MITDDWELAKLDAVNESRMVCVNCEKDFDTHVDLKCLFEPTYFEAMSVKHWLTWRASKAFRYNSLSEPTSVEMQTHTYRWKVDF